MKFIIVFFAVMALLACFVNAIPIEQDQEGDVIISRAKRATCDLLSVNTKIGSLNHSACAAHCLYKGYKGGYCSSKQVCTCRN